MITRTTTIGTLKNYRYDLNRSNNTMAAAMTKVMTERSFNSYAEDPALATRCFQLRRSFMRTNSQLTVNDDIIHKYDVAWQSLDSVVTDLAQIRQDPADASLKSILVALNDPDGSGRNALGQSLAAKAEGMAQHMNGRYGENYVYAGADHLNVPFTWEARENPDYVADETDLVHFQYLKDDGTGTNDPADANKVAKKNPAYDPANADTADPDDIRNYEFLLPPDANGDVKGTNTEALAEKVPEVNDTYNEKAAFKYLDGKGEGTNDEKEASSVLCYRGVPVDSSDPNDLKKLEYFDREEERYIDVGLGYKEKDGKPISSTVFDSALQGTYYLGGYGTEKVEVTVETMDGSYVKEMELPNNIISITRRMSEILMNCNSDNGRWASDEEKAEFKALAEKFEDTVSLVGQRHAEMDTQTAFLKSNSEMLTDTADSLNDQITNLEAVNPAMAIMEYMYARYCYDAALKVGNSVLSQSLMDYMNF